MFPLIVAAPDSQPLYYVIPSVAEESKNPEMESRMGFPETDNLSPVIPSVAEESENPEMASRAEF